MDHFTLKKIEFDAIRRILARLCSTALGKSLCARIGPSRTPETINRWLDQTEQMIAAITQAGLPPLAGATDIAPALTRCTPGGAGSGEDFAAIASLLEAAANIKRYLTALPEQLELLIELAGAIGNFQAEVRAIRSVVAPDGSILDEASDRLGKIRTQMRELTQRIHDVIYGYLKKPEVAKLLQDAIVTLHGDRYVLPVKATNRGRLPGVVHRASNTGATVFVEPDESVKLNNRLVDLRDDERREIERLLNQLAVRLTGRGDDIQTALQTLAQVDMISAKAQYAYQFEMTRPQVAERSSLEFAAARHPLLIEQAYNQEKAGVAPARRHPVIPIDIRLGSDFDLLVVTGSNTGGKTVTLKTLALLVVMGQSGMFVPARRGATMPVFRDVFIDVGDEQSLQQSLSTFGAHIKRIKYILHKADKWSLVLLDELGAGTDPEEGGAIGQAVLDDLLRIGCLGAITTHLGVLKAYAYNHDRVDNASVEFDTKTLSPTYHLRIGTPGESHAITVAQHLGLPKRLTTAARRHMSGQGKQFRKAIQATSVARQTAEHARAEAQEAHLAAQTQQQMYEAKLADLHDLQEQFQTWLAELGRLKSGDEVFVPSLGKTGTLVRLELHKQKAVVDAGPIQVEVPLSELIPDLGQDAVRQQIDTLRKDILDQARSTEQARAEAARLRQELHLSVQQQKERARRFDTWLGAIGRVKVGDEVPIARRPGTGKIVTVDLPGLRATVATAKGQMELSIQDLFPQTGPFARDVKHAARPRKAQPARPPQPLARRNRDSAAAKANRQALLQTRPGEQVFVVPFNKRATLIRLNAHKDNALVQSGIFEMEIPLADLEPARKEG